jgi:hypothetical protein
MTNTNTQTYGTIDAAAIAGVTVRQLNHWAKCGYLRPLRETGNHVGHGGVVLRWDMRDIDAAARFGALSAALAGGRDLLWTFAQALTAPYGEAVGIVMDEGRFTVSIEVRG